MADVGVEKKKSNEEMKLEQREEERDERSE